MIGNFCAGFMGLRGVGGLIVSLIFVAIVVIALIVLFNGSPSNRKTSDQAMTELRLRFARGDISKEEFDRIKASL